MGLQVRGLQFTGVEGEQRGVQVACAARPLTVTVVTMAGSTQPACLSSFRRASASPDSCAEGDGAEGEEPAPEVSTSIIGGSLARGMDASIHCGRRIC